MNASEDASLRPKTTIVPALVFTATGTVFTILFVFALIENILVLIVYQSTKTLQVKTNFWIAAVVICDLLIVLNAFPIVIISSFMEEYVFGVAGCKWNGFIVTFLGTTSIFLLTGLSIYRYIIMMTQIRSQNISTMVVLMFIMMCFLFGLFWGILPLIGWGSFALEGIGISCAPNWASKKLTDVSYTAAMHIIVLLIPLSIMCFCYASIIIKIWREKRIQSDWIKQRRVIRDIRVTIAVAFTILSFIISWTPYAVISLLEAFHDVDLVQTSPMLVQLPCLMAKAACIWNPLVYVCLNSQFRTAFMMKFGFCRKAQMNYRLTMGSRSPEPNNGTDGAISLQRFNSSIENQRRNNTRAIKSTATLTSEISMTDITVCAHLVH